MAIKTILLHLADDPECMHRIETAVKLAGQHRAHITGMYIAGILDMPFAVVGRGASSAYVAFTHSNQKEKTAHIHEKFNDACEKAGLSHSWHIEDGDHLENLSKHAHAADMVVTSQTKPKTLEDRVTHTFACELSTRTGSPVLVLPIDSPPVSFEHIMVAWKSIPSCLRAMRASIPLMEHAKEVSMLAIGDTTGSGHLSPDEAIRFLSRHGIEANLIEVKNPQDDIADVVLSTAKKEEVSIIVMGAPTRGFMKEVLLGNTTRHVIHNTEVPLFLSH